MALVDGYQTIALPAGVVGGTWQINGGSALAYNASAATVESYLETLLGQGVTVTGSSGGPYTVTWDDVGARDLLEVENIDLQVADSANVSTTEDGGTSFLAHMAYSSFGNLISVVDGDGNPVDIVEQTRYLWQSREFDAATGLEYHWRRYLDQLTGGWLGGDPLGFYAGDSNLMRFVGNNPTNGTDPSGEMELQASGAESVVKFFGWKVVKVSGTDGSIALFRRTGTIKVGKDQSEAKQYGILVHEVVAGLSGMVRGYGDAATLNATGRVQDPVKPDGTAWGDTVTDTQNISLIMELVGVASKDPKELTPAYAKQRYGTAVFGKNKPALYQPELKQLIDFIEAPDSTKPYNFSARWDAGTLDKNAAVFKAQLKCDKQTSKFSGTITIEYHD